MTDVSYRYSLHATFSGPGAAAWTEMMATVTPARLPAGHVEQDELLGRLGSHGSPYVLMTFVVRHNCLAICPRFARQSQCLRTRRAHSMMCLTSQTELIVRLGAQTFTAV